MNNHHQQPHEGNSHKNLLPGLIGNMSDVDIPVIDISTRNSAAPTQLLEAVVNYGFVYIKNNDAGIPPQKISEMFSLSKEFFASPLEEKASVSIASNKAGKNLGWLGQGTEKLSTLQQRPDCKEAFNIGEPSQSNEPQQMFPTSLQAHVQTIIAFQNACHALCQRILMHFAEALDIDRDWFATRHDSTKGSSGTVFRLLYYPQQFEIEDGVDIRAGAHSDYGSITLLFQMPGQPGLQIQTPSGEWAPVSADPTGAGAGSGAILVNIGDLLEDWTGGLFKSTVHRVVFPPGELADRYSIAYFMHPLDDAALDPVPSERVARFTAQSGRANLRNGKPMTARDHLMERLAATYKIK